MDARMRRIGLVYMAMLMLTLPALAGFPYTTVKDRTDYLPGQIEITFQPETTVDAIFELAEDANLDIISGELYANTYAFKLRSIVEFDNGSEGKQKLLNLCGQLKQNHMIKDAHPRWTYKVAASTPDDPLFSSQWNLTMCRFNEVWDLPIGRNPIVVAVLDQHFDTSHPDLQGRFILPGRDVGNDDDDVRPPLGTLNSHGTYISGIIAAAINNNTAIAGATWGDVRIFPIKLENDNNSLILDSDIVQALQYIQTMVPIPQVVNMSFEGNGSQAMRDEIIKLNNLGTLTVVAAGNGSMSTYGFSNWPEVITVSAVGPDKTIASYSNYGKIDFAAPGGESGSQVEQIISLNLSSAPGEATTMRNFGTSAASAHVSAAIALLRSAGVQSEDVYDALSAGADKMGRSVPNELYGYGVVDILKSFMRAKVALVDITIAKPLNQSVYQTQSVPLYVNFYNLNVDQPVWVTIDGGPDAGGSMEDYASLVEFSETNPDESWINTKLILSPGAHTISVTAYSATEPFLEWEQTIEVTVEPHVIRAGSNLMLSIPFPYDGYPEQLLGPDVVLKRYLSNQPFPWFSWYGDGSLQDDEAGFNPPGLGVRFQAPIGVAWFAELKNDVVVLVDSDAVEANYHIPLNIGWNMYGTPYPYNIDWSTSQIYYEGKYYTISQAAKQKIVRPETWRWTGEGYTFDTAPNGILYAWEGSWIYATRACTLILKPIPSANQAKKFDMQGMPARNANDYKINLSVAGNGLKDTRNEFGVITSMKSDELRVAKPPYIGRHVNLSFIYGYETGLTRDIRNKWGKNAWDFVVNTDQKTGEYTISWSAVIAPKSSVVLYLQDRKTGAAINMRQVDSYTFRLSGENSRRFRITEGKPAGVK